MKGRPAGTPKSDDPNKKKRKRVARERDLCDVKIKITEYFPGSQVPLENHDPSAALPGFVDGSLDVVGPGQKFWTIQRVNGNGGNGKGDGVAGPHKHTLDRSDEIKKSSIQRLLAKQDKETKKLQVEKGLSYPTHPFQVGQLLTLELPETDQQESIRRCAGDD